MKNILLLLIAMIYLALIVYYQTIDRLPVFLLYVLVVSNAISFILYGVDKFAAIKHKQRVPEKYFYSLALFFGWPASLLGQMIFNHKTTKARFRWRFYAMSLVNLISIALYIIYF